MNKQIKINHILWTCYPTDKKEYININYLENFESLKENKMKKNIMVQKKDSRTVQKKDSRTVKKTENKIVQNNNIKDNKTNQKKESKKIFLKKQSNTTIRKVTDVDPVGKAKIIIKQPVSQFKGGGIGEKNKNWQFSKSNKKNKLFIPPIALKKEPTDPIDNPNVKNQKVVPSSIVKDINVTFDSLDGTPLKSDVIVIGKNAFNVIELGDFDPLAFYHLGSVVTSNGNRYINLISSTGTGANNPISDTYAWAPFNYS